MTKKIVYGSRKSKQAKEKKAKKDKSKKEIDKALDSGLKKALDEADSHEARVEILLTQIAINTKK